MTWRSTARAQQGTISAGQLGASGVSPDQIAYLARNGRLDRIVQGVYLVGGAPLTYRARLWTAVLATDGVLGYATAGYLWGITDTAEVPIHVVVAHARRVSTPPGVRLHRWRPHDVPVTLRDGLPVTTQMWTVLSVIAAAPATKAMAIADRAAQRGWITATDIDRRLRNHPKRHGNPQLRRILAALGDGAAAESERRLHRVLRRAGVRGWRPNHAVWVDGDLVAVVDVAFPERRIAIEVDGMAWHTGADRFQRDRTRQNILVGLGWTVLRFTWADLTERPGYVVALIRRFAA